MKQLSIKTIRNNLIIFNCVELLHLSSLLFIIRIKSTFFEFYNLTTS